MPKADNLVSSAHSKVKLVRFPMFVFDTPKLMGVFSTDIKLLSGSRIARIYVYERCEARKS